MKPLVFTLPLVVALVIGCNAPDTSAPTNSAPIVSSGRVLRNTPPADTTPNFDFYLLNLSWSPEYCYSHRDAPECAAHDTFVLHGLWPQNTNGTYPRSCSNAPGPENPAQYRDLYPDTGLLEHEWHEHGTCSGLSPDTFFHAARFAVHEVRIPTMLSHLSTQTSMPPDQILGLFATSNPGIPRSSLVLSCGNNYLTAVSVCLDKRLHPIACGNVRSCRANVVRIPPP